MSFIESIWRLRLNAARQVFVNTSRDLPLFIREKGVLFIHIPKAAGISVSSSIYGRPVGHRYLRDYQKINAEETDRLFKFCVVRNPWDRLVSAYFYLRQGGQATSVSDRLFLKSVLWKYDTFEKFVKKCLSEEFIYSFFHFVPQFEYIIDSRGNLGVDRVLRFEDLASELAGVEEETGLSLGLVSSNKSRRREYTSYYDREMISIVESIYAHDVELFGYRF